MTSIFYCIKCKQHILGFIYDGCMVCKKKKLQKHLRYLFYYRHLWGIELPTDIIMIICKKASENNDNSRIYNINNQCYRSSIHSIL